MLFWLHCFQNMYWLCIFYLSNICNVQLKDINLSDAMLHTTVNRKEWFPTITLLSISNWCVLAHTHTHTHTAFFNSFLGAGLRM